LVSVVADAVALPLEDQRAVVGESSSIRATALRVCDLDPARRRIDVQRAFSDVGGHIVLGTPKSHQSRTVPIPRFHVREMSAAIVVSMLTTWRSPRLPEPSCAYPAGVVLSSCLLVAEPG
jgi:hypothetical protein